MRKRRLASVLAIIAIAGAACTGDGVGIEFGSPTTPSAAGSPAASPSEGSGRGIALDVEPIDTGEQHALAALRELCVGPVPTSTDDDGAPAEAPPELAEIESQVERVRGLRFLEAVVSQPADAQEIADKLESAFDETYPREFYDRRTVAWQTIGVIPRERTIREALRAFQTGQVIGFYNPVDQELVFLSDGDLGLLERVTLAHELTHAIDDQHFDLSRIDRPAAACRDEAFQAALAAAEGSAQYFATKVLFGFPPEDGDFSELGEGGGVPAGVPPFMVDLQLWPYTAGQAFVTDIESEEGIEGVNDALTRFPTTTEQILHPERYPEDVPSRVDVPDLSEALGDGWGDLDVMQVGEAWLSTMLQLRLAHSTAEAAAEGWDGGLYRAFTDGDDAAVVLTTAWDSVADADAFEQASWEWFAADDAPGIVGRPSATRVTLAIATTDDPAVSAALAGAAHA